MCTPKEIAENYLSACRTKAALPLGRMFLLACLAGAFVALAGVASTAAAATVGDPSLAKLVSGCVFPAGLATHEDMFQFVSIIVENIEYGHNGSSRISEYILCLFCDERFDERFRSAYFLCCHSRFVQLGLCFLDNSYSTFVGRAY